MPQRVRILSDTVVNQIAAGEVVERPSSVIKELLENSIDADSTELTISIINGGKSSIEITDNGIGMSYQDALLAIERYGTSKISKIEDLENIASLGFRGEALPSIAAVSKFELFSRARELEPENGIYLYIEGGKLKKSEKRSLVAGTKIIIRNLFFNVPARKKFLKADATEENAIKNIVTDFALAYPNLRIKLICDGLESKLFIPQENLEQRIRQLRIAGESPLVVREKNQSFNLQGFLSQPIDTVSSSSKLRLVINGRAVRDRLILAAIKEGYGNFLKPGKYPFGLLKLEIPASDIDVNVHPQKAEVRFRDSRFIYSSIVEAIAKELKLKNVVHTYSGEEHKNQSNNFLPLTIFDPLAPKKQYLGYDYSSGNTVRNNLFEQKTTNSDLESFYTGISGELHEFDPHQAATQNLEKPYNSEQNFQGRNQGDEHSSLVNRNVNQLEKYEGNKFLKTFEIDPGTNDPGKDFGTANKYLDFSDKNFKVFQGQDSVQTSFFQEQVRFIAQFYACFLLFERQGKLIIMDMHAAHERVMFYKIKKSFLEQNITVQKLLVPLELVLPEEVLVRFESIREILKHVGIELSLIESERILIETLPDILKPALVVEVVKELFTDEIFSEDFLNSDFLSISNNVFEANLDKAIARLACHASVRSGRQLGEVEAVSLFQELEKAETCSFCPHGRPVIRIFSEREFENIFGRT